MGTLFNICKYGSQMILASVDVLYLYMSQQLYLGREYLQEVEYKGSWTSEHRHPEQCTILVDFRAFFNKSSNNSIAFWDCPSSEKQIHHLAVNKETKQLYCKPSFPCKSSWDFSKKEECDSIIQNWQMTFQASDYKGNHFLFDDNYLPIKPTYTKGGTWLKLIGHSNSWCARATRAITNHVPIGEYHLRFFPKENFNCLCRSYPIESRCHILHKCRRYNNYWNHNRESLNHFVTSLEFNPRAYSFHEGIT